MSVVGVGVLGATGRMGRLVLGEIADDATFRVAATGSSAAPLGPCDVIVDFSSPDALVAALAAHPATPLVTGTTGLGPSAQAAVTAHATRAPVIQAANFSLGVNLLLDLVRRASAALPDADVEIVEAHHRHKRDAPSGTALALGRAVEQGRGALTAVHGRSGTHVRAPGEIGFHALRGGDVVGEHTVWLLSDGERVSLSHGATHRRTFARGALRCARWVVGADPGFHPLSRVLGLAAE